MQAVDANGQTRPAMSEIVGRDAELQTGDSLLDATGQGFALLLRCAAEIGKFTVWAEITDRAEARGLWGGEPPDGSGATTFEAGRSADGAG